MSKEAKRKLPSQFTCYDQDIICKYSCESESVFQSAIGTSHVKHLIVPYHYEMFSFLNSTLHDELVMVEGMIFNAVSKSIKLDNCELHEGVPQFNYGGEINPWTYSGASLDRAVIVSAASLGDNVDNDYANEYCTGNYPVGKTCTPIEGSLQVQFVNTTTYDDALTGEVEKSILSLIKKEITGGDFGTSNLHYVERSSHVPVGNNNNGSSQTYSGPGNSDGTEAVGNIQSSGLSQAVGISSIAAVAMFFAGAAFLIKRNHRRKKDAKTATLSPRKEKNGDVIRLNGTDEDFSDDDDGQSVADPVRSKYYELPQQRRITCLSTISEVSEETDSSVLHVEEPVNRILSESTYEYRTDAV